MFDAIDWTRPWLRPLQPLAAPIVAAANWRDALNAAARRHALVNAAGQPLRFVPQQDLPPGIAYEAHIGATGRVPTRENLHDFFNALSWLAYPRTKMQLNAVQACEIAAAAGREPANGRGPVRDAATLFDENAALVMLRDGVPGRMLADALRAHRWQEAFVARHAAFGPDCAVQLFGHALIEKLVHPYKAITAHALIVFVDDGFFAMDEPARRREADSRIAARLAAEAPTRAHFTPLPVLGIPGWCAGQDPLFYSDAAVFRPKRGKAS